MKEVVIVMGFNAAGKSTIVQEFVGQGYTRINRDEMGGTIAEQAVHAAKALGTASVVLDNTYPTRDSRASIIQVAQKAGVPIRCVWLTTSIEDAQLNACMRMLCKYGKILGPEDFKKTKDPNMFPPAALFAYKKAFQEPTAAEGFAAIEKRKFVRVWGPEYKNKAIILDYDGTLRDSVGKHPWPEDPADVKLLPNRAETLAAWKKKGYLLLGASNQSAIAKGLSAAVAEECFRQTNRLLGQDIDFVYCPHKVPPVVCYCRKPAPAMGATHIWKYKLKPSDCIMVGDKTEDKTFAGRCGFRFMTPEEFFK